MLFIFHFRFRQGRLFNNRPHHRLRPAIQAAIHEEFLKLRNNSRLGFIGHCGVGVFPISQYTKALELFALHRHPVFGKAAALGAKFARRNIIFLAPFGPKALFNFPLNRQTMTVPTWNERSIFPHHLLRADNNILQNFLHGMADMNIAIRIRWTVMQNEFLAPSRLGA